MDDPLDSELREKIDVLGKSITKIFPNYGGITGGGMGSGADPIRNFTINHVDNNRRYKDSKYYLTKHKLGIHYTSIDTLFSILRSKKLRLHSLSGMDDIKELSYARNVIVGKNDIEQEKKKKAQRYIFPFCDYELEENEKSLALWREYGSDGYGCGIVFRIDTTTMDKWGNYHLSQIFYDKEDLEPIKTAYNEYLEINTSQKTKVFGFEDIVVSLYGFHKAPIFRYEEELRLLYIHRPKYENTFNEKHFPYFQNGKESSYIELDIGYKKISEQLKSLPLIKPNIDIVKIVLGYRISEKKDKIFSLIAPYLREMPVQIGIEASSLTKHYQ